MRKFSYIVFALFLLLFAGYSLQLLKAASVLYSFSFAQRNDPPLVALYIRYFGYKSTISELSIPGVDGPVAMRVYTPVGPKHPPTIILIHGFAPEGYRHPVLNLLATRMARTGLRVVLPTVTAETHFQMKVSDLALIGDAIRWSADTSGQRVSVMGISFGGGLAIAAAAHPSVAQKVKLIVCVSGYNSLDAIGHYYIHDRVLGPDGLPYPGRGPQSGPLLFISQYLDEMVLPAEVLAFQRPLDYFKHNASDHLPPEEAALLSMLTSTERRDFTDLQTVATEDMRNRYLGVLTRHRGEIAELSPSTVLPTSRIPLYVLHGSNDPAIPAAEIEWMRQESEGNPDAHFLITPWLTHANIRRGADMITKIRAGFFFSRVMRAALGHTAL